MAWHRRQAQQYLVLDQRRQIHVPFRDQRIQQGILPLPKGQLGFVTGHRQHAVQGHDVRVLTQTALTHQTQCRGNFQPQHRSTPFGCTGEPVLHRTILRPQTITQARQQFGIKRSGLAGAGTGEMQTVSREHR